MEAEGKVSLWFGHASSAKSFWNALEVEFSDDGDFLGSEFSRAFGIGYYDDALREAEFTEKVPLNLEEFLTGASYQDSIVPRFVEIGVRLDGSENCIILLYNYQHEKTDVATACGVDFKFVGAVSYT